MKKYIYLLYCLCLTTLIGCRDEQDIDGYGYLQISGIELDKTVIPNTKASVSNEKMALDILKNGIIVKHVDDWTSLQGESLLLPAAEYGIQAYSSGVDSTLQGFDIKPFYMGKVAVKIEKDVAKPVEIVCPFVQCMVSIEYTNNFKKAFSNYECEVNNEFGSVVFAQSEIRPAYFRAGKALNAILSLTNTDGNTFTATKQIAVKAQNRYRYNITYDVTNEGTGDFTFTVDQSKHEYEVNITVPLTSEADPKLHTDRSEAWGQFAYIFGHSELEGETDPIVFQYRKVNGGEWNSVAAKLEEDGTYSAKTDKLEFGTQYNYRIACGTKVGNTDLFTTESYQEIPNLNFDTWMQSGKNWFANSDASDSYWATGNTGVTSFLAGSKDPITVPVEGNDAYKGKAAKLTTLTGVTLVKSAAGNLFIGSYKTDMTNPSASVNFGRPYTGARPLSLSGYYKYKPAAINEGTKPGTLETDECNIYVRIWDANNKEIGFGEFVGSQEVTEYTHFTFDINYTDLTAKPAKITIVATSSHYGGEFEGSKVVGQVGGGSTLWVDEFELSFYK